MKGVLVKSYVVFILALTAVVMLIRYQAFSHLAPWIDQLSTAAWGMQLANAPHFLPRSLSGQSFYHALLIDNQSFLNQFFRRIYIDPIQIFLLVDLASLYTLLKLLGVTYQVCVFEGVFFSGLIVLLLGLYPFFSDKQERTPFLFAVGAIAALLSSTSFFQMLYSPLGKHNTGAFFLLLASILTERLFKKIRSSDAVIQYKDWAIFYFFQLLAIFTTWLVIFILPAATVFYFLISGGKNRIKYIIIYCFIILAFACSSLAVTYFVQHGVSDKSYSDILDVSQFGHITLFFIRACISRFSIPGFVLGIFGLYLLGRDRKEWMPLMVLLSFFSFPYLVLNFTIINAVNNRFIPYLLPFLILGFAYSIVWAFSTVKNGRKILSIPLVILILCFIAWHLAIQLPILISPDKVKNRVPSFYNNYLTQQGNVQAIIQTVLKQLPNQSAIFTWDYIEQNLLRVLGGDEFQNKQLTVYPALSSMLVRLNDGSLRTYVVQTQLKMNINQPSYLFTNSILTKERLTQTIEQLMSYMPQRAASQSKVTLSLVQFYPATNRFGNPNNQMNCKNCGFNLYRVVFS